MASSKTPVLSLDTLDERPLVRIGNDVYELTPPDGLTILGYRRMSQFMPRLEELLEKTEPNDAEDLELQECFDKLCRVVLQAPDEVLDNLTALQRVLIYQAFLKLPHAALQRVGALMNRSRTATKAATTTRPISTGSRSRRGSHISIPAATSSGG